MRVRSRNRSSRAHATDANRQRRGIVVVLTCILLVVLLGFVAFGVDVGTIGLERAKLQNAVDAAALAASQAMQEAIADGGDSINVNGDVAAQVAALNALAAAKAKEMAIKVAELNGVYLAESDIELGKKTADGAISYGSAPYNLVKVTARRTNPDTDAPDGMLKLSFAPVLGMDSLSLTASAAAYVQSRDIVLVLDFSGSMNDDSEFVSMKKLGKANVEKNLDDIYKALADSDVRFSDNATKRKFPKASKNGDPVWGDMTFGEGKYVSDEVAAIYALAQAYKTSNMTRQQLADTINAKSTSTIENAVRNMDETDIVSGSQKISNTDAEWLMTKVSSTRKSAALNRLSTDETAVGIAANLGLLKTDSNGKLLNPYPQEGLKNDEVTPKGTPSSSGNRQAWRDYVKWVRSDSNVNSQGYRNKFGTRTLVGYMLTNKTSKVESEDLHRAPAYPFHAMKEGTTRFLEFLEGLNFGDRVGIVSYAGATSGDTWDRNSARFETHEPGDVNVPRMTDDYEELNNIQIQRQSAEYSNYTGIGYGVRKAREMLAIAGRPQAQHVIMILTDGNANRSSQFDGLPKNWNWSKYTDFDGNGSADYYTNDRHKQFPFVEAMAANAKPENATIHTMAVGAEADRDLMKAMAFAGGGLYIDVPGGFSIEEMQDQMIAAFSQIASSVPSAQLLHDGDY